jgi:hypothetical protein
VISFCTRSHAPGCENGGVLAGIRLPFVADRARIKNVSQQPQQGVLSKRPARAELTRFARPALELPAPPLDLRQREQNRSAFLEQRKDGPHSFGFFPVYDQPPTRRVYVVAQYRTPAHPLPLAPRRRHLVARALPDQFPFKLGK